MISNVSNLIVYVTAFVLLVDDQIPVVATFENANLCNASSGCDTTNIQLFCPNLLHNVTNALGHITNITNDCCSAK